jgi:hypothetical protein
MRKSISIKTRFEVFKRDGFKCVYCGNTPNESKLEIDHIVPVSKGGTNLIQNLIRSCFDCNRGKSNNLLTSIPEKKNITDLEKERILQYKEYIKYLKDIEKLHNELVDYVCEVYERYNEGYTPSSKFRQNIDYFIKKIGVEKTKEAMEITLNRISGNAVMKYFCGVCWTMYRNSLW